MNWNTLSVPATAALFKGRIRGSESPFAIETEKASIAKPTPSNIELKTNNHMVNQLSLSQIVIH